MKKTDSQFIDDAAIERVLSSAGSCDGGRVREVLAKALEMKGLEAADVAVLARISDPGLLAELFDTAKAVKEQIYGKRLVLFAPLYISNLCGNECLYCAFRARNKEVERVALTQEQIAREVEILVEQGHKRILLVAGEAYPNEGFSYVLNSIETIYATKSGTGEIRRVNANIAPLTIEEFRQLHAAKIGTYQLFQETYHRQTYHRVHVGGKKADYDWRVTAMDRAMEAGIDDVGIGVLFGLCDWRFEILAMMQHIRHLEAATASGRTRSACRGWSRRPARTWRRIRQSRSAISISARSSRSCGWRCRIRGSSCPRAKRRTCGGRRSRWAFRRFPRAAGPIPAATRRRRTTRTPSSFRWAITGSSMR